MTTDPTRNERQRLYRARRKAEREGLVEVMIGPERFWLPIEDARKVARLIEAHRNEVERAAEKKKDDDA